MRDKHAEECVFPFHLVEHSIEGAALQHGEGTEPAGEEEGRHGEPASPTPERGGSGGRSEQSGPAQALVDRQAGDAQQRVPNVHARVVGEDGAGEERILRPEVAAVGEAVDQIEVQCHVAEIVRGENFQIPAVGIDDPKKCPGGSESEDDKENGVGQGDPLPRGGGCSCRGQSRN